MDQDMEKGASELEAMPAAKSEPAPAAESPSPPLRPELETRLERIAEYRDASLAKRNPLLAMVGSANSGLMSINLFLEQAIVQALAAGPSSIEHLQKLQPSIDTYLRVTRQIDRFAQIEIKTKSRRSPASDCAPGNNRAKGVDTDS